MLQQPALDIERHPITCIHKSAKPAAFSDNAMTGYDNRKPIGAACLPNGAWRGMQLRGDIAITASRSAGDVLNGTPYPTLMNSAADMQ